MRYASPRFDRGSPSRSGRAEVSRSAAASVGPTRRVRVIPPHYQRAELPQQGPSGAVTQIHSRRLAEDR